MPPCSPAAVPRSPSVSPRPPCSWRVRRRRRPALGGTDRHRRRTGRAVAATAARLHAGPRLRRGGHRDRGRVTVPGDDVHRVARWTSSAPRSPPTRTRTPGRARCTRRPAGSSRTAARRSKGRRCRSSTPTTAISPGTAGRHGPRASASRRSAGVRVYTVAHHRLVQVMGTSDSVISVELAGRDVLIRSPSTLPGTSSAPCGPGTRTSTRCWRAGTRSCGRAPRRRIGGYRRSVEERVMTAMARTLGDCPTGPRPHLEGGRFHRRDVLRSRRPARRARPCRSPTGPSARPGPGARPADRGARRTRRATGCRSARASAFRGCRPGCAPGGGRAPRHHGRHRRHPAHDVGGGPADGGRVLAVQVDYRQGARIIAALDRAILWSSALAISVTLLVGAFR